MLPLYLYGIVAAVPLLGLGGLCFGWSLFARLPARVLDNDGIADEIESHFSKPRENPHVVV